ncbi:membrane protein [Bradyrhizobium sp. SSBR45G]|uniref:YoaK family protein n=1 Tax=unclassified Bradyrhizobium TaxID=2631580 RepID=UPI002342A471|nr:MULTISPECIES: YoaK family protein [unclassified Bradyrhizobium]GLH79571.1 membrane protein [Bradyrhizobium sp. SSBR45G]GLH87034.1 membrane protein [Bradyrhizobium sp. SSBR45R]
MATTDSRIVPLLLSVNAGYVDTAGFLALQGLFTAHVTGNFVTFGAALALGTSGAIAKLLALPVFCVVVIATRLAGTLLSRRGSRAFEILIAVKLVLLVLGAALAIHFGPFHNGDSHEAILTGMVLVAAMAIQNAVHRIHLPTAPPSTLMTGTTTQVMIDLADRIYVGDKGQAPPPGRLVQMAVNVAAFALGCGAAALLFVRLGSWCFVIPPIVAALTLVARIAGPQPAR